MLVVVGEIKPGTCFQRSHLTIFRTLFAQVLWNDKRNFFVQSADITFIIWYNTELYSVWVAVMLMKL